jgi:DNA primase
MAIPAETLEQIKSATDIVSLVKDYLPDLKRAGRNFKACCPFHNEKTPSFVVSGEKGIFRCFGCNASGDAFKFLMLIENISWPEAVKKLASKAGIEIKESYTASPEKASEKTKLFELLELTAKFYHKCLKSSKGARALAYLKSRNVSDETIEKFMLGFAPRDMLISAALKKGFTQEQLIKAGIITKTQKGTHFEYMSERVVFPIFDVQGRVVAFGGRSLEKDPQAKYLNSPESIIYFKSANLYGLYQTLAELRKERKMIILEGYMDVIITQQYGVSGAVASLGTAFTQQHAKLIARYSDNTTLLFDSDNAGRTATQRALEILTENDISASTSALPEGTDADEFLSAYGKDKFLAVLKNSSKSPIDFMIERLKASVPNPRAPEGKAKIVFTALEFVSKTKNEIMQREWIKTLAQKINVSEDAVWQEFKKIKKFNVSPRVSQNNLEKALTNSVSFSIEENLLCFLINEKSYINKVTEKTFQDARCKMVYAHLSDGVSEAEILNKLNSQDAAWFSSLTLEPFQYRIAEEVFNRLVKDLEVLRLKNRLKELESDIINNNLANPSVLEEYKKLITLLKGSGKE